MIVKLAKSYIVMLKSFLIMAINKVSAVYRIELDNLYSIDKIYRFNIIYIYIYIYLKQNTIVSIIFYA
jgi:hypothetical protein